MTRRLTPLFVPAAIALGHVSSYAVAHPVAAERAAALAGHGHLAPLLALGVLAGSFGLGLVAAERRNGVTVTVRYRDLLVWGVAGFWGIEVVERLVHGHLDRLLTEPAVAIGVLAQVVVAGFLAVLARLAADVGAALPAPRPRSVLLPAAPAGWTPRPRTEVRTPSLTDATRRRGPPVLLRA